MEGGIDGDFTRALLGGKVGRYELGERIGAGGMGEVYRASARGAAGVRQTFAVKVLRDEVGRSDNQVRRFLDEARTAARIHHPNVCAIIDFGQEDRSFYLVMELLDGAPLSELVGAGALPIWLALRVFADAAHGLHAAHELRDEAGESLGLVHRDVSPPNLMVTRHGHTKVLDFGVAKVDDRLAATEAGQIRGKMAYVAPEHFEGKSLDRRADVWALGVVMHEALVGRRLFDGASSPQTLQAVLSARIPPVRDLRPDCPEEVAALVGALLERDREARVASAEVVAERLEECIAALEERADHARVGRWVERWRAGETASVPPLATEATRVARPSGLRAQAAAPETDSETDSETREDLGVFADSGHYPSYAGEETDEEKATQILDEEATVAAIPMPEARPPTVTVPSPGLGLPQLLVLAAVLAAFGVGAVFATALLLLFR